MPSGRKSRKKQVHKKRIDSKLKISGVAGIINLSLFVPSLTLSVMKSLKYLHEILFPLHILMNILLIITTILFLRGFVIIGERVKNFFLIIASYTLIVANIVANSIFIGFDLMGITWSPENLPFTWLVILTLLFVGVVNIFFGLGLLQLRNKFGDIATATGILEIIAGVSSCSIILFFFDIILTIPVMILEVIIIFRACEILQ